MFENVKKEHILKAIKDFEDKGFPNGFRQSNTYDVIIDGKPYPPPAIMAYAYFHAEGKAVEPGFRVGQGSECFESFERNGFIIELKSTKGIKEKFEEWLHNNTKEGSNRVSSYLRAIGLLNEILDYNIYETNDLKFLNELYQDLIVEQRTVGGKYYVEKSPSYGTNGFYSASIKKYVEFLKNSNMASNNDIIEKYLQEFSKVSEQWFSKEDWLEERYLFFKNFFKKENIDTYEWSDFQKLRNNLNSFSTMHLAGANALGNPNLSIEKYREIFNYIISGKDDIKTTINNLFKKHDGHYFLPYFGESTVSELMQYAFPEQYICYNSRTESALKLMGLKLKKIRKDTFGDKFVRFNDLADPIKEKYKQIVGLKTNTSLPLEVDQFFSWLSTKEMPETKLDFNYWIFQGNPKYFDFDAAISDGSLDYFTVSSHKDKIKIGDKVIIWLSGDNAGCYALAEVTSEPHEVLVSRDNKHWKVDDPNDIKAGIKITHNLFNQPILWDDIKDIDEFLQFKAGNQGSNFSATEIEYNTLKELILSNKSASYFNVKKVLDPEKLSKYLDVIRIFIKKNNLNPFDERISFNVRDTRKRLAFIIGSRYTISIEKKKNRTQLSFISKDVLSSKSGEFFNHKGEIEAYWNIVDSYDGFEQVIQDGLQEELERNNKSPFRKWTNRDFINDVFQNEIVMEEENKEPKGALNTIFYGPPGTGKTFTLKRDYFPKYATKETSLTKEQNFENIVKDCSWWQVIAVALLQLGKSKVGDIHNHSWVKQKEKASNSKTVRPTIWGQLQSHTVEECEFVNVKSKQPPLIFTKTADSYWEILEDEVRNQAEELYDLIESVENFNPNPDKVLTRYKFVTFHQSFSYEDFIEGIKPILPVEGEVSDDLGYTIEDGIFKEICLDAANDPDNQYAIFIDEINRGNVSAIFGELITLIEKDKRKGAVNEMSAILPYSKKPFSVPQNLDIYGTMNTADRSVEALDTALRRRFSFVEMMPDTSLLRDKVINDINLGDLLGKINERIELLIDRDHTIGHSYFINVKNLSDLADAFNDKVIPLLQEYFYGDYGKVGLVLGSGFVAKNNNSKVHFAKFEYDNQNDFKVPTFTLNKMNADNIESAIMELLGKAE